jgi:hypothetical protein
MTAIRVPKCTAISIVCPWSGKVVRWCNKIKWALEEIGRNSVSPWIIATNAS